VSAFSAQRVVGFELPDQFCDDFLYRTSPSGDLCLCHGREWFQGRAHAGAVGKIEEKTREPLARRETDLLGKQRRDVA